MSRPYSIGLLNDIHEHFPDLIYRPERFRNVADVLTYIINVANTNPYQQARTTYRRDNHDEKENKEVDPADDLYRVLYGTIPYRHVRPVGMGTSHPVGMGGTSSYRPVGMGATSSYRNPLSSNRMQPDIVQSNSAVSLLSTFISGVMGEPIVHNLQPFLDQPVVIHPTEQQLAQATTLTTALRVQNDACAICQDMIEEGQTMRILNYCTHSFHQECIDTWLGRHVTCPTCRHDIREL